MFTDNAQREMCRTMILKGDLKPKAIALALGGQVTPQDVSNQKLALTKAGTLSPANGGGHGKKKSKVKGKAKDEFAESLDAELDRLNDETTKFARLMNKYSSTNGGFALHLEKKIEDNKERIALLSEIKDAA